METASEELRDKFMTSAFGVMAENFEHFVPGLLEHCEYTPKSALFVDGRHSEDILGIMVDFGSYYYPSLC